MNKQFFKNWWWGLGELFLDYAPCPLSFMTGVLVALNVACLFISHWIPPLIIIPNIGLFIVLYYAYLYGTKRK